MNKTVITYAVYREVQRYGLNEGAISCVPELLAFFTNILDAEAYAQKCKRLTKTRGDIVVSFHVRVMT